MKATAGIDLNGFHAGDRRVMTRVFRRYVAEVERVVRRYCQGVDAECVVQEVFLALVEQPELRKKLTEGDMGAWLRTMAARRAIDHIRRNRRWMPVGSAASLEGALEAWDGEGCLLSRDQTSRTARALAAFRERVLPRLGAELAEVFRLRYVECVSQVRAAEILELPRSTFISREQRLVKYLDRFFRRHFKGDPR